MLENDDPVAIPPGRVVKSTDCIIALRASLVWTVCFFSKWTVAFVDRHISARRRKDPSAIAKRERCRMMVEGVRRSEDLRRCAEERRSSRVLQAAFSLGCYATVRWGFACASHVVWTYANPIVEVNGGGDRGQGTGNREKRNTQGGRARTPCIRHTVALPSLVFVHLRATLQYTTLHYYTTLLACEVRLRAPSHMQCGTYILLLYDKQTDEYKQTSSVDLFALKQAQR